VSAHSAGANTEILLVMVNGMKGGVRAWANFTLMIECTPESSRCYSVAISNNSFSLSDSTLTISHDKCGHAVRTGTNLKKTHLRQQLQCRAMTAQCALVLFVCG
jgi:hypothetical protein